MEATGRASERDGDIEVILCVLHLLAWALLASAFAVATGGPAVSWTAACTAVDGEYTAGSREACVAN